MTYGFNNYFACTRNTGIAYSPDMAALVRKDLRTMSRNEVAEKYFGNKKGALTRLRNFCRRNGIPWYAPLPSHKYPTKKSKRAKDRTTTASPFIAAGVR